VQVGTDANSQLLKDSLKKCGVDLSYLREIEGPSGTAMIMVDPSGTLLPIVATYDLHLANCLHGSNSF
jgi:sugar/nucleoside kinase (ribokinase family)